MPASVSFTIPPPSGAPESVALGQLGADYIDSTIEITSGDWSAISVLTDAVFTQLGSNNVAVNNVVPASTNLNGKAMSRGITIFGRYHTIQLASGAVIAYRAKVY